MSEGNVFFQWGDGGKPQRDGKPPVFHHFQLFRDSGYGPDFIGETSAFAYYDGEAKGGHVYEYSVYGVERDEETEEDTNFILVFGPESFTVPIEKADNIDVEEFLIPPIDYQLTPKKGKLRHAWKVDTSGKTLGTLIEDDETGHAAAYIPVTTSCSAYWDQPIEGYHCFRIRTVDTNLNLSEYSDWVCAEPLSGGTIGDNFYMFNGIVYDAVEIGDDFNGLKYSA
jgi:hypothetical protein